MKKSILIGVALAVGTPAVGQQAIQSRSTAAARPPVSVQSFRKNAQPQTQETREKSPVKIYKLMPVTTVPWAALAAMGVAADAEAMKGWTPLTNGAAQGGAALIRGKSGTRVMVRAADGYFYMADIDPAYPGGPLSGSAWKKTALQTNSEADCRTSNMSGSPEALCAYLGSGGAARTSWVSGTYVVAQEDMGGHDAGARPTLGSDPESYVCNCTISGFSDDKKTFGRIENNILFVWDGGTRLFRRKTFTYTLNPINYTPFAPMTPEPTQDILPDEAGWKVMAGTFESPVNCIGSTCVAISGNSVGTFESYKLSPDNITGMAIGKPVPGGVGKKVAPVIVKTSSGATVVVVRNASGRLYQRIGNGDWIDEGGAARSNAQLACLTNQEQPTCFIQGPDGRIWWKQFKTAGGL